MAYIEREALGIGRCNSDIFENKYYADGWNSAIKIIEDATAADVVDVRHGKWLPQKFLGKKVYDCSECKMLGNPIYRYCPHCGSKMDGKDDSINEI